MDAIADGLSTRICFVIFCVIAFVPLFFQHPADVLGWDQYISQTVIQLVALSVLAIVSKKEGKAQQRMLQETHDTVMIEMAELKVIMEALHIKLKDGVSK